mgnify:CR=1 FL=1
MNEPLYIDIILPLPLNSLFTYSVPKGMEQQAESGCRVLVPFGKSKLTVGLIVRCHNRKPDFAVKDISRIIDSEPVANRQQLELWQWVADYYMAPIGDVFNAALPAGLKTVDGFRPKTDTYVTLPEKLRNEQSLHVAFGILKRALAQQKTFATYLSMSHWDTLVGDCPDEQIAEVSKEELMNEAHATAGVMKQLVERKFLTTYEKEVGRLNCGGEPHPENIKRLSAEQQEAYNGIMFQFLRKQVVLLRGVTSSGKTEIYIHLIRQALERHEQVLYLLPEIALTVQIRQRLQRVFGDRLGIYHSKYSDAERVEIWKKQLSPTPYGVILGARSAALLPFSRLGLVIIDEEHETSFKQQDPAPRYHARSVAIMLARQFGAKTLLGSATPSAESWHNAETGKYGLAELDTRYKGIELPQIQVVDVKEMQRRKMMYGPVSPLLLDAMRQALEAGEQVILFQNRRGFAPMIECRTCGWVPKCENCDVSLTLHKNMNQLTCHYCGFTYAVPRQCPNCECEDLRPYGYGTEKIEEKIMELFPGVAVARMDLDTTRSRNAYEQIINDFSTGRTKILIGTQMVSKGLDFDHVSVVGILNADSMLNMPDFRAYEHAFTMMSQVAGRAGRKGKRGRVILQTKDTEQPIIRQVVANDWRGFYAQMLAERRLFHYPPFYRLIYVYLKHKDEGRADTAALEMGGRLRQWFGARVLGPDKPPVSKVRTLFIRKIMLKLEPGIDIKRVRQCLFMAQQQMEKDKRYASLQIYYDVDPS